MIISAKNTVRDEQKIRPLRTHVEAAVRQLKRDSKISKDHCLFVELDSLRSIKNLQLNRDGSSWVEPVLSLDKCVLLKHHNAVTPVRLEPATPRSRVKHSTTEPLRSLTKDQNDLFRKVHIFLFKDKNAHLTKQVNKLKSSVSK